MSRSSCKTLTARLVSVQLARRNARRSGLGDQSREHSEFLGQSTQPIPPSTEGKFDALSYVGDGAHQYFQIRDKVAACNYNSILNWDTGEQTAGTVSLSSSERNRKGGNVKLEQSDVTQFPLGYSTIANPHEANKIKTKSLIRREVGTKASVN